MGSASYLYSGVLDYTAGSEISVHEDDTRTAFEHGMKFSDMLLQVDQMFMDHLIYNALLVCWYGDTSSANVKRVSQNHVDFLIIAKQQCPHIDPMHSECFGVVSIVSQKDFVISVFETL